MLGPGRPKCELLYENVVKALDELEIEGRFSESEGFYADCCPWGLGNPWVGCGLKACFSGEGIER